jgi:hypothetical protein
VCGVAENPATWQPHSGGIQAGRAWGMGPAASERPAGRCRPMWGICSPRSARRHLGFRSDCPSGKMQCSFNVRRGKEISICRFQLRLSASTEHVDEGLQLAVTSTLLGVPGEGPNTGPSHWRRCAVEKSHALFIHSLWTRATSMLTDFSLGRGGISPWLRREQRLRCRCR